MEEIIGPWLFERAPAFFRRCDRIFQRPIHRVVSRFEELKEDPSYALESEIRIGKKLRIGTGLSIGLITGVFFGGITAIVLFDEKVIDPGWPVFFAFVGSTLLIAILVAAPIAYWLSNGVLFMRSNGIEFVSRRVSVICPWGLFTNDDGVFWHGELNQLIVPVNFRAIKHMVERDEEGQLHRGWNIISFHISPWRRKEHELVGGSRTSAELLLSDIYKCQITEIIELLRHAAQRLVAKS